MYILILSIIVANFNIALASFCGPSSIPFSFEALSNSQPVLGCARPLCFGWNTDGEPASAPAAFYQINGKRDGYFRRAIDSFKPKVVKPEDVEYFRTQIAECSTTYDIECSTEQNNWVGGISPIANASVEDLSLQCCKYDALKLSEDRGIATIQPGQIVFGGEVLHEKRQYAFDYISDIKKELENSSIVYHVSVRRMLCLPYPPEFSLKVEDSVLDDMIHHFTKSNKKARERAYQAPILTNENSVNSGSIDPNQQLVGNVQSGALDPIEEQNAFNAANSVAIDTQSNGAVAPQAYQPISYYAQSIPRCDRRDNRNNRDNRNYRFSERSGGGSSYMYCFTGDTEVQLMGGRKKRMDQLAIGDWVLTENHTQSVYSVVKSWIHREPNKLAQFYRIELEDKNILKITGKHFIYKTKCSAIKKGSSLSILPKPVYAENVQPGDCLYVQTDKNQFKERRVRSVKIIEESGIYSPMTDNGKIVVNNILASCYNVVESPLMQKTFFTYVKKFRSMPIISSLFGSNDLGKLDLPIGMTLLLDFLEHIVPLSVMHSSLI